MSRPRAVLVLGHGAGGDRNDPLFRALDDALPDIEVVLFNFPYRERGRSAPGSQAESEAAYRDVATSARRQGVPLYIGGKSYGGRIATHIAADGFEVDGLVLMSYPLHPPGKPEKLRDAHLAAISAPMLFIQGTRDPFATPELLDRVMTSLPRATLHRIDGGDHSLRVRGRPQSDVVAAIAGHVSTFIA